MLLLGNWAGVWIDQPAGKRQISQSTSVVVAIADRRVDICRSRFDGADRAYGGFTISQLVEDAEMDHY